MAAKVLLLLALVAAAAYAADSECKCDTPTEAESSALWEFFKALQKDPEASDDMRLDAVLAGELSPLLDCNCLDKSETTRRKRKVMPEITEESDSDSLTSEESDKVFGGHRTPKCPKGYAWFGILCVDENLVMDK